MSVYKHPDWGLARPLPEKIREGREAKGYTLEGFAEKIGVSKQAVAQYETGQTSPGGEVFKRIVAEAGQPIPFFTNPRARSGEPSPPYWRSLKRMGLIHRKRLVRRLQWASDAFGLVEQFVDIPPVNLPRIDCELDENEVDQIEAAANKVRDLWGLGRAPIRHLGSLMEENGIVLVRDWAVCPEMDGVCCWIRGRPFVLVAREVTSGPRDNFNLAHELAHLILHPGVEVSPENLSAVERQANRFAGCLLLPRESFGREVFGTSISHFVSLKQRWGTAISAMAYRCKDLGLFTPDQFAYLFRQMNAKKIRKREPLDDAFPVYEPQILRQAMMMIVDHGVCSRPQIEEDLALNSRDIESVCGLDFGYLEHRVVQLQLKR